MLLKRQSPTREIQLATSRHDHRSDLRCTNLIRLIYWILMVIEIFIFINFFHDHDDDNKSIRSSSPSSSTEISWTMVANLHDANYSNAQDVGNQYVWTDLKTQSTFSHSKQVRPQGTVSYGGPICPVCFLSSRSRHRDCLIGGLTLAPTSVG